MHRLIPKNFRENHRDIFNVIHQREVPLTPLQNFAQANPDKVKPPRQVRNIMLTRKRKTKVRFQGNVNIILRCTRTKHHREGGRIVPL